MKNMIFRIFCITFLSTALLASSTVLAASGKSNPATYTCAELIEVDIDYIPQVVYWIDGYNWAGEEEVGVGVDWFAVPVETIVTECEKNPSQPAAKVIKKHSKKHNK